jgi:hypothetical protein
MVKAADSPPTIKIIDTTEKLITLMNSIDPELVKQVDQDEKNYLENLEQIGKLLQKANSLPDTF